MSAVVRARTLLFELPHEAGIDGVRLGCDGNLPGPRSLRLRGRSWRVAIPRPPLARLEYKFAVTSRGRTRWVVDPQNPATTGSAFGDQSVLEFPGYAAPTWVQAPATPGRRRSLVVPGSLAGGIPLTIWSPHGSTARRRLPLLVVHDGPEYDLRAQLIHYCAGLIEAGTVAPFRVALTWATRRNAWYSGSERYLSDVVQRLLPTVRERYAVRSPVVVMGASLGGLTSLLLGLRGSTGIGGVFAQSGSFFSAETDADESAWRFFGRVNRLVGQIAAGPSRHPSHPSLDVVMTCGLLEGNQANNAAMASALAGAGHAVRYATVPDLHNFVAWRDALDPHLSDLLQRTWA